MPTLEAMAWTLPARGGRSAPCWTPANRKSTGALSARPGRAPAGERGHGGRAGSLCRLIKKPTLFLGDGLAPYRALFEERLGDRLLLPPLASRGARPACVAELGRRRLLRGERDLPETLIPCYLRPSEAELRRRPGVTR